MGHGFLKASEGVLLISRAPDFLLGLAHMFSLGPVRYTAFSRIKISSFKYHKYPRLSKFIQKNDPDVRMPRIFSDLRTKSAFYMCFHVKFWHD